MDETFFVTHTDEFRKNDIAVFNCYEKDFESMAEPDSTKWKRSWQKVFYRIAACSADRFEIKNGELIVNGKEVSLPPKAKINYEVQASAGNILDIDEEDLDNFMIIGQTNGNAVYNVYLPASKLEEYRKRNPAIVSVKKKVYPEPYSKDNNIVQSSATDHWTIDNFGPLTVPSPGETITINADNYSLYQHLPDVKIGSYTIKEKLYFFLGDNRHEAMDSRFRGLISHSNMVGVVKNK